MEQAYVSPIRFSIILMMHIPFSNNALRHNRRITCQPEESARRTDRHQTIRIFIPAFWSAEDNRAMNKQRDLLPWIFGGLSAAAVAIAFAAVSTHRIAPSSPAQIVAAQPAASPTALPTPLPAPPASPAVAPAAESDAALSSAPPSPAQTAMTAEVPAGQIWQCVTHGVKTFSNNPCGEKSTQLEVGPINTMSAAPAVHYVRAYGAEPRYSAGSAGQGAPAAGDEYPDDSAAESGGNSYTIIQGARFIPRRRPEHHNRTPPTHHNPAPVRRY